MKHVLAAGQFCPDDLESLFEKAQGFERDVQNENARRGLAGRYTGYILLKIFYEASTRTSMSFGMAARHLGMEVEGTENARVFSSAAKGETLEDTIRVLNMYDPAVIVLRHDETGAADRAAAISDAPIINAGDGKGEHPTQSLLDLYTIQQHTGRLDNLKVVMGGDLAHGRTARSLAQMLSMYPGNQLTFVSIPELSMGEDIKERLNAAGTSYDETDNVLAALKEADVVYWTRLQTERLDDAPSEDETEEEKAEREARIRRIAERAKEFVIDQRALAVMQQEAIIMHPLPRVGEIRPSVDTDPRAAYFRQAGNGLYVRMAVIDTIMRDAGK